MSPVRLSRLLVAEFIGTAFLLAAVVGSGILAHGLDQGNIALSVLCVSFATMGTLCALIFAFGSISAHFNPIVTLVCAFRREIPRAHVLPYICIQIAGAIAGVAITNLMFGLPALQISDTTRSGPGIWLGEFIATFGLIGIILGCGKSNPAATPIAVPLYVAGAIFFTSSTCFANPAVTIARVFTATLTGIEPGSVGAFVAFQLIGAAVACKLFSWLFAADSKSQDKSTVEALDRALKSNSAEPVLK